MCSTLLQSLNQATNVRTSTNLRTKLALARQYPSIVDKEKGKVGEVLDTAGAEELSKGGGHSPSSIMVPSAKTCHTLSAVIVGVAC